MKPPVTELFENQQNALREGTFDRLYIKRIGEECYLIIEVNGDSHVWIKEDGTQRTYRHARHIKQWLWETFGIEAKAIGFEKLTY